MTNCNSPREINDFGRRVVGTIVQDFDAGRTTSSFGAVAEGNKRQRDGDQAVRLWFADRPDCMQQSCTGHSGFHVRDGVSKQLRAYFLGSDLASQGGHQGEGKRQVAQHGIGSEFHVVNSLIEMNRGVA